ARERPLGLHAIHRLPLVHRRPGRTFAPGRPARPRPGRGTAAALATGIVHHLARGPLERWGTPGARRARRALRHGSELRGSLGARARGAASDATYPGGRSA